MKSDLLHNPQRQCGVSAPSEQLQGISSIFRNFCPLHTKTLKSLAMPLSGLLQLSLFYISAGFNAKFIIILLSICANQNVLCLSSLNNNLYPITGHEGPEGEQIYSSTLPSTLAPDWGGCSMPLPSCFTPVKDTVPIVQELGWAPGPVALKYNYVYTVNFHSVHNMIKINKTTSTSILCYNLPS